MIPLQPGDILVCRCGERSRPLWHTGVWHKEGWPLLATWAGRTVLVQDRGNPWCGLCPTCADAGRESPDVGTPTIERAVQPYNTPCVDLLDVHGRVLVDAHQTALPADAYTRSSGAGEGPFRVEPGDRSGSSSSVQKAPLERPRQAQLGLGL